MEELFPDGHWKPVTLSLVITQALLAFVATIAVGLRLYARVDLKKRLALDDVCIVIGLVFAIARAVVASLSSQSGWASRKGPEAQYQVPYYLHYFERRLFYALSAFFIRSGVLLYYLRLFPRSLSRLRLVSWVLLAPSFAQCVQLCVTLGVFCDDILDLYRNNWLDYENPRCSYAYGFTYSGASGDAVVDAMIYILPLPYVWGLKKLRLDQRLGLVFVFGIGIIACIFAMLQIPFIILNYRLNPTTGQSWFGSQVSTFIAIELCLGLVAASLPDLRGLIARVKPGFMAAFRHVEDSSSGGPTNSNEDPNRDPERQNAVVPSTGISIGGGVRLGGEYGVSRKVKKPDFLASFASNSLWRDSPATSAQASRSTSRTRSRSRGAAAVDANGERVRAGRPSIVPELSESHGSNEKTATQKTCEMMEGLQEEG